MPITVLRSGQEGTATVSAEPALQHKGFSLVNIQSPCITYNKGLTFQWYKEHLAHLDEGHDPTDFQQALHLVTRQRGPSRMGSSKSRNARRSSMRHRIASVARRRRRKILGKTLRSRRGDLKEIMWHFL